MLTKHARQHSQGKEGVWARQARRLNGLVDPLFSLTGGCFFVMVGYLMLYRTTILTVLGDLRHARVEDVFHALKPSHPAVSITTVYRNIKTLEERGDIVGFLHPDGSVRYEVHSNDPHQHLICEICGAILEVKFRFVEELSKSLEERARFRIHSRKVNMVGRCAGCDQKSSF